MTRLRRGGGRPNHTCPSIHTLPVLPGLVPVFSARRAELVAPSCFLRPSDVSPRASRAERPLVHPPPGWGLHGTNTPLLCLTLAMASLGVSWAGRLRVRHSHDGLASGRASETRGCPLAGRDLHGNPLHTDLCFWRLLLALCAIATPEAVLGECVAMLLRLWIEPRRKLHR